MIDAYYEWFKVMHIIAFTAWMAGMFYLPRLFVYHTEVQFDTAEYARFLTMERKLLKIIINPSMILTFIFGIILAYIYTNHDLLSAEPWLYYKFSLVLIMSALHGYFVRTYKAFLAGKNNKNACFYRILNEVPTVIFTLIVILVIIKPFS